MKQLQPVIWMKGTFLSPQHLQTQDRFIENSLQFQLESLSFQPWGFESLAIDQEARRLYVSHTTEAVVIDLDTEKVTNVEAFACRKLQICVPLLRPSGSK